MNKNLLSKSIYKYGPLKYLERTLNKCTLGFRPLKEFNDIYESDFRIAHYFHSLEDEKKLLDGVITPFNKITKLSKEYLDSLKVTCFSLSPTNNLMWAHYSDNHNGICYVFESPTNSTTPFDPKKLEWGSVIYSSHVPEIKIYQDQTTEGMLNSLLNDVVLTKSQDWSYEKEVRFFKSQKSNSIKFNPNSLKAIILGRRIPKTQLQRIKDLISKYNQKNNTEVELLYAHRIATRFDLGISEHVSIRNGGETQFSAKIPVLETIKSNPVTEIKSKDNKKPSG